MVHVPSWASKVSETHSLKIKIIDVHVQKSRRYTYIQSILYTYGIRRELISHIALFVFFKQILSQFYITCQNFLNWNIWHINIQTCIFILKNITLMKSYIV